MIKLLAGVIFSLFMAKPRVDFEEVIILYYFNLTQKLLIHFFFSIFILQINQLHDLGTPNDVTFLCRLIISRNDQKYAAQNAEN